MGKTALVTGATTGIGAAYAKRLASEGYNLVVTGRRKEIIDKLANQLSTQYKVEVEVITAEFSNEADIQKVVDVIKSEQELEILVNNAGFNDVLQLFAEKPLPAQEDMMKVLMTVPVRLCYAAIPGMSQRGHGKIINISSGAAVLPSKKSSIYAACKAFIKLFSESLYLEVKDKGIKVQTVLPGYIDTDFYRGFTAEQQQLMRKTFKAMSADAVVECSMRDLGKNCVVCVPGLYYKALMAIIAVTPRSYWYKMIDKTIK
jgi:uncharacterized protein